MDVLNSGNITIDSKAICALHQDWNLIVFNKIMRNECKLPGSRHNNVTITLIILYVLSAPCFLSKSLNIKLLYVML
jgi:hypothetical protein